MVWRIRNSGVQYPSLCQFGTGYDAPEQSAEVFPCHVSYYISDLVASVRDYRFAMVRHAVFGGDTWRFAAMLGTRRNAIQVVTGN